MFSYFISRSTVKAIKGVFPGFKHKMTSDVTFGVQSMNLHPNRSYLGITKPNKNVDYLIDLRSDTVTRPSPAMRQHIANAEVGDDVFEEDQTVKELERRVADLLGKESAVFVPSGTMGNLLACNAHVSNFEDHRQLKPQNGICFV